MLHHLQAQAEFVVEEAQKRGVSAAEAFVTRNENLSLRLYRDAVDSLRHATTSGLGLRLINEQRPGYAFTSDLSSSGLTQLVIDCLENARYSQPDPELSFPESGSPAPEMHELHHPEFRSFTLDQKIDVLREIESAAMDEDPRVTHILRNHFGEDLTEVAVVNSEGIRATYSTTMTYAWVELMAEGEGSNQTGNSFTCGRALSELDPRQVGMEAAEQACSLLGARPVKTTRVPVVIAPKAAINILSQIAQMLSAEAVQKGRSLFRDLLGQQIAAPIIDVIDDATLVGGWGSRPVDVEGVPSRANVLIQDGVLQGWMHNTTTARRGETNSTGNASRISYRSIPTVGATNFYLAPGADTEEELMRKAGSGLYILELMGMHAINPITGKFSGAARGYWMEGGERTYPVTEVTLGGEYLSLLNQIVAVGNNLEFYPGSAVLGSPSLLVSEMTVSGL